MDAHVNVDVLGNQGTAGPNQVTNMSYSWSDFSLKKDKRATYDCLQIIKVNGVDSCVTRQYPNVTHGTYGHEWPTKHIASIGVSKYVAR